MSSMNFEDADPVMRYHGHAEIKDEPWCQIKMSCGISIRFRIPHNYVSCSWHPVVVFALLQLPCPPTFQIYFVSASSDAFLSAVSSQTQFTI